MKETSNIIRLHSLLCSFLPLPCLGLFKSESSKWCLEVELGKHWLTVRRPRMGVVLMEAKLGLGNWKTGIYYSLNLLLCGCPWRAKWHSLVIGWIQNQSHLNPNPNPNPDTPHGPAWKHPSGGCL